VIVADARQLPIASGTPDDPMPSVPEHYAGCWLVVRHSGRRDSGWRIATGLQNEADIRRFYRKDYERVRQGGIRLVSPDGAIIHEYWAPRVRTRW
jgi:hypothetical protein